MRISVSGLQLTACLGIGSQDLEHSVCKSSARLLQFCSSNCDATAGNLKLENLGCMPLS